MSVVAGLGKIKRAAKDLRIQWAEVKVSWHDRNSQVFEEKYISPMLARLKTMEMTMGNMAATLQKTHHDCE